MSRSRSFRDFWRSVFFFFTCPETVFSEFSHFWHHDCGVLRTRLPGRGGQAPPAIDPQNISMAPTPVAGAFAGRGGVRGRGLPLPPAIDAPKHKHGSHVFPPSAAKHAQRCSAPPRTTSGLAQPWLSVCPRGRSCLKMFQSENMYARRCGCDSIVNARRDTNGTTATACLNAETHVGPGANRGEAAGV